MAFFSGSPGLCCSHLFYEKRKKTFLMKYPAKAASVFETDCYDVIHTSCVKTVYDM